jgi:hypothetical protein
VIRGPRMAAGRAGRSRYFAPIRTLAGSLVRPGDRVSFVRAVGSRRYPIALEVQTLDAAAHDGAGAHNGAEARMRDDGSPFALAGGPSWPCSAQRRFS